MWERNQYLWSKETIKGIIEAGKRKIWKYDGQKGRRREKISAITL